jgi:hypothetical protein
LSEDILTVPLSEWNPEVSLDKLKARRAGFPTFISTNQDLGEHEGDRACRITALDNLKARIEEYRTSVADDPDKFGPRKGAFLHYLMEWDQVLASSTYPLSTHWWKF